MFYSLALGSDLLWVLNLRRSFRITIFFLQRSLWGVLVFLLVPVFIWCCLVWGLRWFRVFDGWNTFVLRPQNTHHMINTRNESEAGTNERKRTHSTKSASMSSSSSWFSSVFPWLDRNFRFPPSTFEFFPVLPFFLPFFFESSCCVSSWSIVVSRLITSVLQLLLFVLFLSDLFGFLGRFLV